MTIHKLTVGLAELSESLATDMCKQLGRYDLRYLKHLQRNIPVHCGFPSSSLTSERPRPDEVKDENKPNSPQLFPPWLINDLELPTQSLIMHCYVAFVWEKPFVNRKQTLTKHKTLKSVLSRFGSSGRPVDRSVKFKKKNP